VVCSSWLSSSVLFLATAACTTAPSEPIASGAPTSPGASTASPRPIAIPSAPSAPASSAAPAGPPSFPHDVSSFTEGLVYDHGTIFESTGLYGESKLRKIDLATGRVLAQVRLTDAYFGEGLALLHGELFQLTYKEGKCFVYDAATLQKKRELAYDGEGWGLTTDGTSFVMSDGSATLTFRDAKTFEPVRRITVIGKDGPVLNVNELEWVNGFIVANVWETNFIIRIDPASGRIVQAIDLSYLPEPRRGATDDDVLNGIAYDEAAGQLLVTGKRWSHLFQLVRPW
jgi:glutamine cyclotransferase